MALRSPASSFVFSVNASIGQTLILIAADGARVSVSRAIATEASYVLRDLLDGQDLVSSSVSNNDVVAGGFLSEAGEPSPPLSATGTFMTVHDLESLFEDPVPSPTASQSPSGAVHNHKAAVPDLMDFFSVAPTATTPTSNGTKEATKGSAATAEAAGAAVAVSASASSTHHHHHIGDTAPTDDVFASLWGPQPNTPQCTPTPTRSVAASTTHVPPLVPYQQQQQQPSPVASPVAPAEVELAFPYFNGDILERVCRHMSYRFRMSSFGTEDGCYRVYMVKTRTIPRPMTLPLVEYLDLKDRRFIADWDELITVQMVKAATLLNYEELLQLASAKLASYLIERDLEGVRTFLGVESDFDAVDEAELKKEQVTEFNR
ncbi:hypothetical protein N2W54_000384 [Lotmaria passim]